MKELLIYDNGGKTYDRYTILVPCDNSREYSMIAMSENGAGINTYVGEIPYQKRYDHLGKKVSLDSLNEELQTRIIERLVETPDGKDGVVTMWGVNFCLFEDGKYVVPTGYFPAEKKEMSLLEAWNTVKVEYHREPTEAEVKFGEGAIHYLSVPLWRAIKSYGKVHSRISISNVRYRR